jgi:hypothetical protein
MRCDKAHVLALNDPQNRRTLAAKRVLNSLERRFENVL